MKVLAWFSVVVSGVAAIASWVSGDFNMWTISCGVWAYVATLRDY